MTDSQSVAGITNSSQDKVINFINEQVHNVADSLQHYGPIAVNSIGKVKQYQAIGNLVSDIFSILFTIGISIIGIYLVNKACKYEHDGGDCDEPAFVCLMIGGVCTFVVGSILSIFSICQLVHDFPSLIVSISSPDNAFVWYIINDVIPHLKK